jgi:SAM-dependent methyltransferase
MIDHDAKPGKLERCQITGSSELFEIIDIGHQAPCDALLRREMLNQPEKTYPLRLLHCPESGLAQLDYVVDGREIYYPAYPYRSGISKPLVDYLQAFADSAIDRFGLAAGTAIVDIGSNDGTLLACFKRRGMNVVGVEPTDVAKIARGENGVETIQAVFTETCARDIAGTIGKARIVTATNTFAHMAELGEVCRGVVALLADEGVFIVESHYLLDILELNQFDTIYHEHIRTYSLKALVTLFPYYGMEVFDVQRADRYGGNIRAFVAREGRFPVSPNVGALLKLEVANGLHEPATWAKFRARVYANRDRFMEFAWGAKARGMTIAGNSCPGRCATLLNYYGVGKDIMPYICELPTSLKLGMHLPGSHIPIVPGDRLVSEQPDYVVLNAWHYAQPIAKRLRQEGVRSKLVVALPDFAVLDV